MTQGDKLTAARSANRDAAGGKPGAKQDCSEVVNISVFFDGTGNNRDVDEKFDRWSNVARLWFATQLRMGDNDTSHAIYLAGVGTPYNKEHDATGWFDQKMMSAQDVLGGQGFGAGGMRRTDAGEVRVNDRLRLALKQSAAKLNISLAAYIEKGNPANIKELASALEAHGLVTVINISIFGFSRGAALARAFSNEMLRKCSRGSDGTLRYNGMPIRFNFLGLFDTVASFGFAAMNIDMPFDERNLVVPSVVERCVHYVAAHELRFSFSVDLIRRDGKLQPNWTETIYPGVHSDVGGGYEPVEQGISHNYARIPMRDMMLQAAKSGVRLVDYDDVEKYDQLMFETLYEIQPETFAAYRKYMAEVKSPADVEAAVTAHMKALYSAWGTMTRRNIKTPDIVAKGGRTGDFRNVGHPGVAYEAKMYLEREETVRSVNVSGKSRALTVESRVHGFLVRPAQWRLDAWQATASDAVLEFIRHNVHDSKAGFIHACEPFSYFTARGMAESSRNVLAQGLDWVTNVATTVKKGIVKVYHRAEGVVVETWEAGKLVATRTYRVGEKFVVDTVKAGVTYTVEVYQSTKEVVIRTAKRGQQMVITSINTAKKHISDAADATQKKASEVADATQKKATEIADATQRKATELANATQKKVGEIADATQRAAREVGTQVYDGASSAAKSVGQAVDSGLQAVEDGWTSARQALGY